MKSKQFTPDEQAVLEDIMRSRRDVRGNRFTQQGVDSGVVDKILQSALYAPSVGYSQPWQFVVIRDHAIKQQVVDNFNLENEHARTQFSGVKEETYSKLKLDGILEAPVNIAVFYNQSNAPVLGQTSMPEVGEYSVVCAVQNMWLMARALNVGLGWVSILNPEKIKQTLNVPNQHKLVAYLCLGYVDEFYERPELELLKWEKAKSKDSVIHYEEFSQAE